MKTVPNTNTNCKRLKHIENMWDHVYNQIRHQNCTNLSELITAIQII